MTPYQLREQAKEYLATGKADAESNLLRTGTSLIPLLVEALVERLRSLNALSWSKSDFQKRLDSMPEGDDPYLQGMRAATMDAIRSTPDEDEPGMSWAQISASDESISRAWKLASRTVDGGLRALITILRGNNPILRSTAALILNVEKPLSRDVIKALLEIKPFLDDLEGEPTGNLLTMALAMSGHEPSRRAIEYICKEARCTQEQLYQDITYQSILFVASS